ncbi:MAG: rhomboid family intramembrane serine protease [Bacteroidota bacterium]
MKQEVPLSNQVLLYPLVFVLMLWTVYWVEVRFGFNLNTFGIYPRDLKGLRGILLSPFIHGSVEHLFNNSIPIVVLTAFLFHFYRNVAFKVLLFGVLLSGLITWGIGRSSYHIGASGIIYVLASFIFFTGIFSKYYRWIALSLIVVFIYGSLIWYVFPIKDGISWEGHLGGFLTGLLLALFLKVEQPKEKQYEWELKDYDDENDMFLQHFDENGNFIEKQPEIENTQDEWTITYEYKKNKGPDSK